MRADRDSLAAFKAGIDPAQLDHLWADYAGGPETDETPAQILDQHLREAQAVYDPDSGLARRVDLRLSGPNAAKGRIDIGIAHEVFQAFGLELSGAAEFNSLSSGISLELVGVSEGSAVLHLVPSSAGGNGVSVDDAARFDDVFATITELHQAAESRGDLQRFAEHQALVRGLRTLAETLGDHDLDMEIGWRSRAGVQANSRLTGATRSYLRELGKTHEVERELAVSGRVVRLDLGGQFAVKVSPARNSKRYDIQVGGEEALVSLRLELGQTVHVWVAERKKMNNLNVEQSLTHHFIRMLAE